jgi:hypothetical protein
MHAQVRQRTLVSRKHTQLSHVMQYGDLKINNDFLASYIGAHPTKINDHGYALNPTSVDHNLNYPTPTRYISQRDAHLFYLKTKVIFFSR